MGFSVSTVSLTYARVVCSELAHTRETGNRPFFGRDVGPIWRTKRPRLKWISFSSSPHPHPFLLLLFFFWNHGTAGVCFWVTVYSIWQNIKSVCTTKIADYIYRQTICLVLHVGETIREGKKLKEENFEKKSSPPWQKKKKGFWAPQQRIESVSSLCPKWLKCHW